MSVSQTSDARKPDSKPKGKKVEIKVNTKTVTLDDDRVTGLEIKQAAIDQGVEIELDFLLTLEAFKGDPARIIGDADVVKVKKGMEFTANDVDDDS